MHMLKVPAIIKHGEFILCVQRPYNKLPYISNKFEFPGGKIEASETLEEALQRELSEELNLKISEMQFFLTVNYQYPDFKLLMHSILVNVNSKLITLNEHISQKWLLPKNILELDWAAADLPIVHKLMDNV